MKNIALVLVVITMALPFSVLGAELKPPVVSQRVLQEQISQCATKDQVAALQGTNDNIVILLQSIIALLGQIVTRIR